MTRGFSVKAFLVVALAATVFSCAKGPKVIPKKQMEKIYREMFLADQWLAEKPERRSVADTTWFYNPIFEKYGYTVEDYRASVDYYLSDPKRYAEMLGRVADGLDKDLAVLNRDIKQKEKIRHRADSIAKVMKTFRPDDFTNYGDIFYVNSMTDRIEIRTNSRGVYIPVPVVEDTVYHGPELIIKDSSSVLDLAPEKDFKPIVWRE